MKIFIILLALFSSVASGGTLVCGGKVDKLGLHATDKLMLKLTSMNTAVFICSPNKLWEVSGATYKTSPETCRTIISFLMHAKTTGLDMGSVYFDGDDVPANCNSWESWKNANIRHFLY
jgi:hypothetical protein